MEKGSGTDGIEKALFARCEFDESLDVLATPAAAAGVLESKPCFDLAWHYDARTCGIAYIGIGDSLAQAQIHEAPPWPTTIMRSILSMPCLYNPVN
jgi:hypothetical protein